MLNGVLNRKDMIKENIDITHLTTFGIPVKAKYFAEYASEKELLKISRDKRFIDGPVLNIGGGSNLLFIGDYNGLVLHSMIKGIVRYDKNPDTVFAIVGAGEKWTDFVEWTLCQGLGGIENLAGIPGEVGSAPVQNVGAYGVEACDVIHAVECFDTITRTVRRFTPEECCWGYRDSFFKHEGKNRFIVMRVSFRLRPDITAQNLEYGPLRDLSNRLSHVPTINEVAEEVIRIRNSKLPDPKKAGNAGSFFKNPVLREGFIKEVEAITGNKIPVHKVDEVHVKISAAWLIEQSGMKGEKIGGAKVSETQPLVIVNENNATASDVVELADKVRSAVRDRFLIDLVPEVNYIDTTLHVTILGSGTSKGIPEIGCSCRVCRSPYQKDKRLRTSVLLRTMGMTLLIDPSPDFRQQALAANLHHIDAVLITHSHYDHVGGMDDLRPFSSVINMPLYANKGTCDGLRQHYDYCFKEHPYPGVPKFDLKEVGLNPFYINGLKIVPIEVMHGKMPILGFRIGNFAYITDAKTIDYPEINKLEGVDTLVVNALRERDHFSHFTIEEALKLIDEVRPRVAYLTHFNHEIGLHHELDARLPNNVHPSYDGQKFDVK